MPRPQKYRDVVRFLRSQGWHLVRQGKGSHEVWGDDAGGLVVVPRHGVVSAGEVRQLVRIFPDTAPLNWRQEQSVNATGVVRRHVDAVAYRDGDWWTIEIPELRSTDDRGRSIAAVGQAASLRGLDSAVRDIAAVWLDTDPDSIVADVTIRLPEDVEEL